MDVQDYLNEECKRIKRDILKEFDSIINPMEKSLALIANELNELEYLCSHNNILSIIHNKKAT